MLFLSGIEDVGLQDISSIKWQVDQQDLHNLFNQVELNHKENVMVHEDLPDKEAANLDADNQGCSMNLEAESSVQRDTGVDEDVQEDLVIHTQAIDEHNLNIGNEREENPVDGTSITDSHVNEPSNTMTCTRIGSMQNGGEVVKLNRKAKEKAQLLRTRGKSYLGVGKGSKVIKKDARQMRTRCKHKDLIPKTKRTFLCNKFSDQDRSQLFADFWSSPTWAEKKGYVRGSVCTRNVLRRRKTVTDDQENTKKNAGRDIYLGTANGERVRVCRTFFINTLGIGEDSFKRWTKNNEGAHHLSCSDSETDNPEDQNNDQISSCVQRHDDSSKTDNIPPRKKKKLEDRQKVCEWLGMLPKVPSHYCRKSSKKIYVESSFRSKLHMYSVFDEWCRENSISPCCRTIFMETIAEEKIDIHLPRKDKCDTCCAREVGQVTDEEYARHVQRKDEARAAKNKAKESASSEHTVVTMDLQSILLSPKLITSQAYYKQKLQVHNFTIYNLKDGEVTLYVWHEANGGVTANEFTSCITDFITNLPPTCTMVTLISDGCNYQNRNKVLASALSDLAKAKDITVEQLFLEKGHTMMECDSVHATLEHYFSPPINSPMDYVSRMRQARPKKPYKIRNVDFTFFKNFDVLKTNLPSLRPGKKSGDPVVIDICQLQYLADGTIKYKLHHTAEFEPLPQRRKLSLSVEPTSLYSAPLPITQSKFDQLQELKQFIERDHHPFYDNLSTKPDKVKK